MKGHAKSVQDQKGEPTFMKHGNLTVMRWKEKKDVIALSTLIFMATQLKILCLESQS